MSHTYQSIASPVSPLDPFVAGFPSPPPRPAITVSRATSTASTMTTNTTRQFFNAVYLDSPSTRRIPEETRQAVGSTKPLRVRKKLGTAQRVVPRAGNRRRHRSTMSLPRSPTSPLAPPISTNRPGLVRNDTTSTNSSAHRAISQLFLTTPPSPSPSPPPVRRVMARNKHRSSLYLGLGRSDTAISPLGLSPPSSPSPSPHRSFYYASNRTYRSKPLPIPPIPMTPTRAPRKAAMLLGTDVPLPKVRGTAKKALTGKHFRPLPDSTKVEIDKFFGDVTKPPKSTRARVPSTLEGWVKESAVGGEKTVGYEDEQGRMWRDVEEEAEYAWLMADSLAPSSISPPATRAPSLVKDATSSEDDKWDEDSLDMERFTSVLSLAPAVRANRNSRKADKILGITRGDVEDSYLDLGMDAPLPTIKRGVGLKTPRKRTVSDELAEASVWTNRLACPAKPGLGSSGPTLSPRTPTAAARPTPKRTDSGDKRRPPPLTLAPPAPRRDLPVLTPTTPLGPGKLTIRSPTRVAPPIKIPQLPRLHTPPAIPLARRVPSDPIVPPGAAAPTTPFVRPRKAPAPAGVPPVPGFIKKPSLAAMTNPHLPVLGGAAQAPGRRSTDGESTDDEEQVSWFEPVTPVEAQGEGFKLINGGTHARKVSGAWLGKMRKTSGGKI